MEEQRTLAVLNRTAAKLNAELDLTALLQAVIEAGVELTGAEFGALFGGGAGEGIPFSLYALSGIDRQSFETLPLPREEGVVGPIIKGEGIFRWDDVTTDPKFAAAMAEEARKETTVPVRSYLAVPLLSALRDSYRRAVLRPSASGHLHRARRADHGGHRLARFDRDREGKPLPGRAAGDRDAQEGGAVAEQEQGAASAISPRSASDLLWETDERFRITSIVGDSRAVFGLAEEELIGRTAWEFAKADVGGARLEAAHHRSRDAAGVP